MSNKKKILIGLGILLLLALGFTGLKMSGILEPNNDKTPPSTEVEKPSTDDTGVDKDSDINVDTDADKEDASKGDNNSNSDKDSANKNDNNVNSAEDKNAEVDENWNSRPQANKKPDSNSSINSNSKPSGNNSANNNADSDSNANSNSNNNTNNNGSKPGSDSGDSSKAEEFDYGLIEEREDKVFTPELIERPERPEVYPEDEQEVEPVVMLDAWEDVDFENLAPGDVREFKSYLKLKGRPGASGEYKFTTTLTWDKLDINPWEVYKKEDIEYNTFSGYIINGDPVSNFKNLDNEDSATFVHTGEYLIGEDGAVTVEIPGYVLLIRNEASNLTAVDNEFKWELLTEEAPALNFDELKSLYDYANGLEMEDFRSTEWNNLLTELIKSYVILNATVTSQKAIDEQADALRNAIEDLRHSLEVEHLEDLLDFMKDINFKDYDKDTVKALKQAIKDAENLLKDVYKDKDVTQADVDKAYNNLVLALNNLKAIDKGPQLPPTGMGNEHLYVAGGSILIGFLILLKKRKVVEDGEVL